MGEVEECTPKAEGGAAEVEAGELGRVRTEGRERGKGVWSDVSEARVGEGRAREGQRGPGLGANWRVTCRTAEIRFLFFVFLVLVVLLIFSISTS